MHRFYILISVLFSLNIYSQEQFNRIYGFLSSPALFNIEIIDNGYVAVGAYTDTYVKACVIKYNLNGDTTQTIIYKNDTMNLYVGAQGSLQATGTGNYILAAQNTDYWYRNNMLVKFNSNFDTIFTKTYYAVDDNGYKDVINYNTCVGKDTSYLLVGTTNIDNNYDSLYQYQMQLIKTDTLGDLLWRKTYGNDTVKHYGYKVVNTFDGGYLLGGWSNINSGDWAIVKVDENGENPVFKYFGSTIYDEGRIMGITTTTDSCYLLTGSKSVNYEFSEYIKKARIIKLDKNLNIIWDKLYLNSGTTSFFFEVLEKNNEKLVSYGAHKNSYNYTIATILELTSQGDSIWRQETTSYDSIQTNNYLSSSKITPDGGMIFGGYTYNSASLTPAQQMWLVKTDSMGCDGTEWTCGTTYLEALVEKGDNNLILYPNPVRENLHISLNLDKLSEPRLKGLQDFQDKKITNKAVLNKIEFDNLLIDQKLKYSSKNPNNTLWGKKEEQEMRELSRKLAYAFPFEVIKGKVDIFSIDPALNTSVIARNEARMTKQSTLNKEITSSYRPTNDVQEITIYDIFGRIVKKETLDTRQNTLEISVSSLEKGVYFVQIGNKVAKFVKE